MSCSASGHRGGMEPLAGRGTGWRLQQLHPRTGSPAWPWIHQNPAFLSPFLTQAAARVSPQTSYGFPASGGSPKGVQGRAGSALHPQRRAGGTPNPPPLRTEPCPGSAPSRSSHHHLPQAGEDPPHGKHRLSQPRPRRRGQCRTCSSSYFSQNLLVKGRQVRYSTQRQFTGYT